jgi:hypothetical protein
MSCKVQYVPDCCPGRSKWLPIIPQPRSFEIWATDEQLHNGCLNRLHSNYQRRWQNPSDTSAGLIRFRSEGASLNKQVTQRYFWLSSVISLITSPTFIIVLSPCKVAKFLDWNEFVFRETYLQHHQRKVWFLTASSTSDKDDLVSPERISKPCLLFRGSIEARNVNKVTLKQGSQSREESISISCHFLEALRGFAHATPDFD